MSHYAKKQPWVFQMFVLMSRCFWASVQGIMEEMAMDKDMKAPDPGWIVAMLK